MKNELHLACRSMGYRKMANKDGRAIFGKPVGYSLFTIMWINGSYTIEQWFLGANKKLLLWSKKSLPEIVEISSDKDCILREIKDFEALTKFWAPAGSSFEFMSAEEHIELLMDM